MTTEGNQLIIKALTNQLGQAGAQPIIERFINQLPPTYTGQYTTEQVASDLIQANDLSDSAKVKVHLYTNNTPKKNELHLKLFQLNESIPLSDVLPLIENMGLKTLSEYPHDLILSDGNTVVISDFKVTHETLDLMNVYGVSYQFEDAFIKILNGQLENDGLNELILKANLTWQDVVVLRAYLRYLLQTKYIFSQAYTEKTLCQYPDIASDLVQLFKLKHDPKKSVAQEDVVKVEARINKNLESVVALDQDKILRRFLNLVQATLRTNYFQPNCLVSDRQIISFKFNSLSIPDLPQPKPMFEIFVYSPRLEGVHLRGSKVARGGIRWSDRHEDYRNEILGLMKAQKVKNALIVPSGAKGGFIIKQDLTKLNNQERKEVVTECYQNFVRGLLDITDNIINDDIKHPYSTVCYDDHDPYFVVAADKGTASFSDVANAVAEEYHFWLGDAFASGGSAGYDHKKIGITARGAWESLKRHLLELNKPLDESEITVVGIGDMSGDVFGNGLLYSDRIKLVAAFDHRDIFVDPNPHLLDSYNERKRLFYLPTSSWQDYSRDLISKGGGVFSRREKSIHLSDEMKALLDVSDDALPPNELIQAILKAPVDVIYNGGIGTYVKATTENTADVGDKANESCRVNGGELRAKIVTEGGNLGFTQLGRVEYALNGGLINADFIDNSAGVNCSDHEVNIKILLNKKISQQELSKPQADELLSSMTDEVANLVLHDNYQQALVMSFSSQNSSRYANLYMNHIKLLEQFVSLDRVVEFLPTDKVLKDRQMQGQGLTRPELAVLLAYTKIHLKNEILKSQLPEDGIFNRILSKAFPEKFSKQFASNLAEHPLKREIISTQLSNDMVNTMGITFAYRMQRETGADIADIARAYHVSKLIFAADNLKEHISHLDYKVPVNLQYELLHHVRYLINLSTRWFLHNNRLKGNVETTISHYRMSINQLSYIIPDLIMGTTKKYLKKLNEQFLKAGLSQDTARRVAISRVMYSALNITEIATTNHFDLMKTARVYFMVGGRLGLVTYRDQLASDNREGDLNSLTRLALRDELDLAQRELTNLIMSSDYKEDDAELLINLWLSKHEKLAKRWNEVVDILKLRTELDYTMLFIAMRELSTLLSSVERPAVPVGAPERLQKSTETQTTPISLDAIV